MRYRGHIAMISEHANPLSLLGSEDAGGQNVYVYELSLGLARLGYRVDVFTRRDDPRPPETVRLGPGVRVVHVPAGPPEFIRKDDLWEHMPAFMEGCHAYMAGQRRGYSLIHSNFWMSGWVACELKLRLGLPVVHIFHALGAIKRLEQGRADTSPRDRLRVERRILREADRILAQCPAEVEDLERYYGGDLSNVCVVPSGVNIRRFRVVSQSRARARLGLGPEEQVIGYIGRMVPRKGVDTLIRAFARLVAERPAAPLRLMIVGGECRNPEEDTSAELARLRGLAESLGVASRTWFVGKRQPDELAGYYGAADIMVSVPWYEPFGLTPLEAQACGRAFVGSAVGGITFTVVDGVTGLLVPPRDDAALAEKLALLLDNADLRQRLGRAARRRVQREFTWAKVAEHTAGVYEELLAGLIPVPAPAVRVVST